MKVSELIKELQEHSQEAEVFVEKDFQWAKAVFVFEDEEWTQCHICTHTEKELATTESQEADGECIDVIINRLYADACPASLDHDWWEFFKKEARAILSNLPKTNDKRIDEKCSCNCHRNIYKSDAPNDIEALDDKATSKTEMS